MLPKHVSFNIDACSDNSNNGMSSDRMSLQPAELERSKTPVAIELKAFQFKFEGMYSKPKLAYLVALEPTFMSFSLEKRYGNTWVGGYLLFDKEVSDLELRRRAVGYEFYICDDEAEVADAVEDHGIQMATMNEQAYVKRAEQLMAKYNLQTQEVSYNGES